MTLNNKILPVAVVAALLGGSVGAFVMRPSKNEQLSAPTVAKQLVPAQNALQTTTSTPDGLGLTVNGEQNALTDANSNSEVAAYRQGFSEGVNVTRDENLTGSASQSRAVPASRVIYRNQRSTRSARRYNNSRQVYYDYGQPRSRSFWQKHRDKLTVAGGAGGGAIIGGLIGGKKGAAIGALAGGGGSALYTYKLRKKNRNY